MPIFVTEEITEDPREDEFREKIHKEYDGLVLRTEIPPRKDIPDRGAYTYAHIPAGRQGEGCQALGEMERHQAGGCEGPGHCYGVPPLGQR